MGAKSFLLGRIWVSTQRSKFPKARQLLILTWCENIHNINKNGVGFLGKSRGTCAARGTDSQSCNSEPFLAYPRAVPTALWAGVEQQARRASSYCGATNSCTSCLHKPCKTPVTKYTSHCICSLNHNSGYFKTPTTAPGASGRRPQSVGQWEGWGTGSSSRACIGG